MKTVYLLVRTKGGKIEGAYTYKGRAEKDQANWKLAGVSTKIVEQALVMG